MVGVASVAIGLLISPVSAEAAGKTVKLCKTGRIALKCLCKTGHFAPFCIFGS